MKLLRHHPTAVRLHHEAAAVKEGDDDDDGLLASAAERLPATPNGDLEALARYLDDPRCPRRLRRRAATYVASSRPGGGKASTGFGSTDPRIIPILAPLLEGDPDPSVRRAAAYGLRRTGDQGAVAPLLFALSDTDKATRIHAAMGLGDLRSRAAVKPLSELLDDPACGETAARALVEIRDESALASLKAAAAAARTRRQRDRLTRAVPDLEDRVGMRPSA